MYIIQYVCTFKECKNNLLLCLKTMYCMSYLLFKLLYINETFLSVPLNMYFGAIFLAWLT